MNNYNLLDVDTIINKFLQSHAAGISTIHRIHFHNDDSVSKRALIEELMDELKTGCVTYLNKDDADEEGINPYLFYIVNAFCKKKASVSFKKKTEYLCPGCLYLGKDNLVSLSNKIFKCDECESSLKVASDAAKINFYRTFSAHSKLGYRCDDCKRFIPHPQDNTMTISCPYFDCCFVGNWSSLHRMNHPTTFSNIENLIVDSDDSIVLDKNASVVANQLSRLELQEKLQSRILVLEDVIESQKNSVPYNSSEATVKHKFLAYEAIGNVLKQFPLEMSEYLLDNSRSGGFQHKIFQEYISLWEKSLPFFTSKNKQQIKITSLLDNELALFDGISHYESVITDKLSIKNETEEFYIGGRKGSISRRYYIGKILNIINLSSKQSLMGNVVEYTFSKIKLSNVRPNTRVLVSHLRVPPHYQMGGMTYINRARKKIVDRAILVLNKSADV